MSEKMWEERSEKMDYERNVKPKFGEIRDGFAASWSDKTIRLKLGISGEELKKLRRKYPEFDLLWRQGQATRDSQVEEAVFARAAGIATDEESGEVRRVAPDVRAALFWLKSRDEPGKSKAEEKTVAITLLPEEEPL